MKRLLKWSPFIQDHENHNTPLRHGEYIDALEGLLKKSGSIRAMQADGTSTSKTVEAS